MDYEQLRKIIDDKLATDPEFRTLVKRINSGRANFIDTSRYSQILSQTIGKELSKSIESITDKEAITQQLLKDSYNEINDVCARVQERIDSDAGVHINPQQASFPKERVESFSHSLVDLTVDSDVIRRRARAGSETITKSFHDSYIKKNAQFRNDAGFNCYIVREGRSCCKWCADVAGKYKFGEQPDGIFRRHDNCNCTIIYDGQTMRGKFNSDGTRSKTWEEIPNATGEYSPTIFSEHDGSKLEQRNLRQFRGLTNSSDNDKIRNIRLDDVKNAAENSKIEESVAKAIFEALGENNGQYLFDNVAVVKLDFGIVMQTDPIRKGTFFDVQLNLNENFLGGKTVEQIDEQIRNSDFTVANSLREAVIHEKYHAKLISELNQNQLESLYDILSDYHIDGISPTAWKDGSECIAEVGVLFERGETDDLPQQAKDLFNRYIGGIG